MSMKRWKLHRTFVGLLIAYGILQSLQYWAVSRMTASGKHQTSSRGSFHPMNGKNGNKQKRTPRVEDNGIQPLIEEHVCRHIPRGISAPQLWQRYKKDVAAGLQHIRDPNRIHHDWIRQLLDILTPAQLEYSLKSQPEFEFLRPLTYKLARRILYLQQQHKDGKDSPNSNENTDPPPPPPLKILVFGGSIVEGTGCPKSPIPGGKLEYESLQECAWPFRLQHLLDYIAAKLMHQSLPTQNYESSSFSLIEIVNLAAGGTHSEAAIPVLDYWLSPHFEPYGADLIVNAYSANDNLPPAFHGTMNTTVDNFHWARILKRNIEFSKAARYSNRRMPVDAGSNTNVKNEDCSKSSIPASHRPQTKTPIILYVNDYLGNQQESILGEHQLDSAIQWLADHDPTLGYVSVTHSVQHWVYADTSEEFFSASWKDRKGRPTVNVHYGVSGHVTTTIAVAYYLLHLLLDFCEENSAAAESAVSTQTKSGIFPEDWIRIDIPSKEWVQEHQPVTIEPMITEALPLMAKASNDEVLCPDDAPSPESSLSSASPCLFAFLAAPLGTHQRLDRLTDFLRPHVYHQEQGGWNVRNDFRQGGFQNKLGLVASQNGSRTVLGFPRILQPVRTITVHYLKSYGEMWQGSLARFRVRVLGGTESPGKKETAEEATGADGGARNVLHEESFDLEGDHDQKVSISYLHKLTLAKVAPVGSTLRFEMTLIGGKTFKINALMFCSR